MLRWFSVLPPFFSPLLRALLLMSCVPGLASAFAAGDTVQQSAAWQDRVSFFRAFRRHADVVMIGDSITDGAEWKEMFPGVDIANRGIDSDTTAGVLARLDDVLAMEPELAFVMIGINDFATEHRSVDAVFANYRRIVQRLAGRGARVVVQSTLPCHEEKAAWKDCAKLNGPLRELNARLPSLAGAGVVFVDLRSAVAGPNGQLRPELTTDGIHLNGAGYAAWKQAVQRYMPPPSRSSPGARR